MVRINAVKKGTEGRLPATDDPMSYQVKELLLPDGKSPYADWFATLDAMAAAKIRVAVARMEQGNLSNVEWFRGIGEYKLDWVQVIASIWRRTG